MKDPVRLSKLRQISQAPLAASSFSSWFIIIMIMRKYIQKDTFIKLLKIIVLLPCGWMVRSSLFE